MPARSSGSPSSYCFNQIRQRPSSPGWLLSPQVQGPELECCETGRRTVRPEDAALACQGLLVKRFGPVPLLQLSVRAGGVTLELEGEAVPRAKLPAADLQPLKV